MQQAQQNTVSMPSKFVSQSLFNHQDWKGFFEPLVQMVKPQWSTRYTRAQIVNIRVESVDTYTLVLSPRSSWGKGKGFNAGQYVSLWVEQDGRMVSRYFSISSSPAYYAQTGLIELTIQSQYKGKVTPWMQSNLKQGNAIGISDAMGEFVMEAPAQPALFLAAGSGITPFRSMLQQAALTKSTSPMTLLYYTRGEEKQVFAKELQALAQDYPWITVELIDTTHRSRVNVHHIAKYCDDAKERAVFICGPQGFIQTAQKVVAEMDVSPEQVCIEQFQLAARPSDKRKGSVFLKRMNKQSKPTSGKTLLEIAEYEGATPNAGCRMGICHQCKCQKKEGTVMNVLTGEYSDSGEETIQLCVSVPIGQVELDL